MKRVAVFIIALSLLPCFGTQKALAQRWSVSTNLLDYLNFGTINAQVGVSVHKNWTLALSGRYNPFFFDFPDRAMTNKKAAVALKTRYWPFFVHSGFFYGAGVQYTAFRSGGIISPDTREGMAAGAMLEFGYSLMLSKHFNIEFGIGLWGGITDYRQYNGPKCGKKVWDGTKGFLSLDQLQINLLYNF